MDNTTLIRLISERLDPDELVDVLGYSTAHLCILLRKDILDNKDKFYQFLEMYDAGMDSSWFETETDNADSDYE